MNEKLAPIMATLIARRNPERYARRTRANLAVSLYAISFSLSLIRAWRLNEGSK